MNFSEKLFELRKKSGLSQEELADKINVSRQTVSKWEMNQSSPEMEKLIALSQIFNTSIDDLVGNERLDDNKEVNENHAENMHPKARMRYFVLKLLSIILIIYFCISLFKFILLTRQYLIANSFDEPNYSMTQTIITHDDTLPENPSYLTVSVEKIGNRYLETQYPSQVATGNPTVITYIDTDKKESYVLSLDKETNKYHKFDGFTFTTDEEKENHYKYYGSSEPLKSLSTLDLKLRIGYSLNPLVFVNPFTKTTIVISPFTGTSKYEYNRDYLMSRITIKLWGSNKNSEWTISYNYVLDHYEGKTIENPVESSKYELIQN